MVCFLSLSSATVEHADGSTCKSTGPVRDPDWLGSLSESQGDKSVEIYSSQMSSDTFEKIFNLTDSFVLLSSFFVVLNIVVSL